MTPQLPEAELHRIAAAVTWQFCRAKGDRWDDLFQAAWVGILRAPRTWKAERGYAYSSWVFGEARHGIQEHLRVLALQARPHRPQAFRPIAQPDRGPEQVDAADWWETVAARIPAREREWLVRQHVGGELQREIAATAGVSQECVSWATQKVIRGLRS